jgi:hypothetical protein
VHKYVERCRPKQKNWSEHTRQQCFRLMSTGTLQQIRKELA